jgi:hypothetical protein
MNGFDPLTLLDLVGEVVRCADLERLESISQGAFDRTAGAQEKFARVPPARSLTWFFLQGWRDLVELSLREPQSRARTPSGRVRAEEALWLNEDCARNALRVVCRRLDGAPPSREAYRRERAKLIAAAGRNGALIMETLPTEDQIESLLGQWDGPCMRLVWARSRVRRCGESLCQSLKCWTSAMRLITRRRPYWN